MDDESGESMELMKEVTLKELGEGQGLPFQCFNSCPVCIYRPVCPDVSL